MKMEVVLSSPGHFEDGETPYKNEEIREWSGVDQITGMLEQARIETGRWRAFNNGSAHSYGKVIDSRQRNSLDGTVIQKARRQVEIFQSQEPGRSIQVVRASQWSSSRVTDALEHLRSPFLKRSNSDEDLALFTLENPQKSPTSSFTRASKLRRSLQIPSHTSRISFSSDSSRNSPEISKNLQESHYIPISSATTLGDSLSSNASAKNLASKFHLQSPKSSRYEVLSPKSSGYDILSPKLTRQEVSSPKLSRRDLLSPKSPRPEFPSQVPSPKLLRVETVSPKFPRHDGVPPKASRSEAPLQKFSRPEVSSPKFPRQGTSSPKFSRHEVLYQNSSKFPRSDPPDQNPIAESSFPKFPRSDTPSPKFSRVETASPKFARNETPSPKFSRMDTASPKFPRVETSSPKFPRPDTSSPKFPRSQVTVVNIGNPQKTSIVTLGPSESSKIPPKKVGFCKTEIHFAADSGKVNIVETDGKPPSTNKFRRRRRHQTLSPNLLRGKTGDLGISLGEDEKRVWLNSEANPKIHTTKICLGESTAVDKVDFRAKGDLESPKAVSELISRGNLGNFVSRDADDNKVLSTVVTTHETTIARVEDNIPIPKANVPSLKKSLEDQKPEKIDKKPKSDDDKVKSVDRVVTSADPEPPAPIYVNVFGKDGGEFPVYENYRAGDYTEKSEIRGKSLKRSKAKSPSKGTRRSPVVGKTTQGTTATRAKIQKDATKVKSVRRASVTDATRTKKQPMEVVYKTAVYNMKNEKLSKPSPAKQPKTAPRLINDLICGAKPRKSASSSKRKSSTSSQGSKGIAQPPRHWK